MNQIVQSYVRTGFLALMFMLLGACGLLGDRHLEQALDFAGENREELEKVLAYYKDEPEKLAAARFLIRNMPRWYAHEGWQLDSIETVLAQREGKHLIPKKLIAKWKGTSFEDLPKLYDCRVITSEYLIENIDLSFDVWKRYPWARKLGFDDFCELILPYRIDNEPLSSWRKLYHDYYSALLDSVYPGEDVVEACRIVATELKRQNYIYNTDFKLPHLRAEFLFHHRVGYCREVCDLTLYAMRACGIPVATEFFAHSPDYQGAHSWNSLLDTTGRFIPFSFDVLEATRVEIKTDGRKKGKVFRYCFGLQKESMAGLASEVKVPSLFKNRFIKDVSINYFGKNEVLVPIQSVAEKYVYLGVFTTEGWAPIDIALNDKGWVAFRSIEEDIIYQPLFSDGKRHAAAGFPFVYSNGKVRMLKPDAERLETVVLRRKMSMRSMIAECLYLPIIGSKIEGANNPSFVNADLLYQFNDTLIYHCNELVPYEKKKYRYVRYVAPLEMHMELAEFALFRDSLCRDSIYLRRINDIQPIDRVDNVTDGDILTFFKAWHKSRFIAYDLGKATSIGKIVFYPRNDDNFVCSGHEYELFYQDGVNGWISLGKKVASSAELSYLAPSNALLWLRDRTKGREEQVFFYGNGKQIFTMNIKSYDKIVF